MTFLEQTKALFDEMVENRRFLHRNPETGYELPVTSGFVREKLESYGYEVQTMLEYGLIVELGKEGGKTVLLRADMDALPIQEQSGLDFASEKDGFSHTCGHDIHTSIMLAAAKVLKENEDKLAGRVRIEFQPAEELLTGSKDMVDAGLLEGVDVAFAGHVQPLLDPAIYFGEGISLAGANNFEVNIKGVGAHGAMPHTGIDPVYVGTQIVNAFQGLTSREVSFDKSAAITVGGFESPGSRNVIPDHVRLEGTMRTFDDETRNYLKERMPEVVEGIAKVFRTEAELTFLSDVPPLYNNPELTAKTRTWAKEVVGEEVEIGEFSRLQASEDFAFVSQEVPTTYFFIGMAEEGKDRYAVHHPKAYFNEDMMPYAAAIFVQSAINWLEENK